MPFHDRHDAGVQLAAALQDFRGRDSVVLALPRGGVPVAAEVARALGAPLDVLLVRKIGAPGQPEFAVGSVIDGGEPIVIKDQEAMRMTGTRPEQFDAICRDELAEIERRRKAYRGNRPLPSLRNRVVIVIDDGLATGSTMRAALRAVRQHKPAMLVMAVPVAPRGTAGDFRDEADRIICLEMPESFRAVGYFYEDFAQVSDEDVIALLKQQEQHSNSSVRVSG